MHFFSSKVSPSSLFSRELFSLIQKGPPDVQANVKPALLFYFHWSAFDSRASFSLACNTIIPLVLSPPLGELLGGSVVSNRSLG